MSEELQRTPEWFADKLGRLSASRVSNIIPGARGKYLAAREALLFELLVERITGARVEQFVTKEMQHGIDFEPVARERYSQATGNSVEETGFIHHRSIANFGASPDGLVSTDGVLEVKAPSTSTVLKILSGSDINPAWAFQVQCEILVTHRQWADLVIFDPRLQAPLDLTIITIKKDKLVCELIETEARKFNAELDELELKIRERQARF